MTEDEGRAADRGGGAGDGAARAQSWLGRQSFPAVRRGGSGHAERRAGPRACARHGRPHAAAASETGAFEGPLPPSSEWRFHLDVYRARPDVNAVVHMHSTYATTLATLRRHIPAVHYMIAAFGGPTVPCVGYASYGTPELSRLVVEGLKDRDGVLLANHGAIVVGANCARRCGARWSWRRWRRSIISALLRARPSFCRMTRSGGRSNASGAMGRGRRVRRDRKTIRSARLRRRAHAAFGDEPVT